MLERRYGLTIEADIHGMRCEEARRQLELLCSRAPRDITEIVVIHGCHGGTALLDMVRNSFSHPRVQRKYLSMNNGQTTLVLRKL